VQLIDEAIVLHYGEWILMKVTGFDDHKMPYKGIVLAHSPSRDEVSQVLRTEPLRSTLPPDAPYQPYYTFKAFQRARVGETIEQASERFAVLRAAVEEGRRGQRRP